METKTATTAYVESQLAAGNIVKWQRHSSEEQSTEGGNCFFKDPQALIHTV